MERTTIFTCGKCGEEWANTDYPNNDLYGDGYECPTCKSEDISSVDED